MNAKQFEIYSKNQERFDRHKEKIRNVMSEFARNKELLTVGRSLYFDFIEVSLAHREKDYSNALLFKTAELLNDFEVLKQNPKIQKVNVAAEESIKYLHNFKATVFKPKGKVTETETHVNFNLKWKI